MFKQGVLCVFLILIGFISNTSLAQEPLSSIQKIEGIKIYLKPQMVQVAKNGIFIQLGEEIMVINHLEMDDMGVYFDLTKIVGRSHLACCPLYGLPLIGGICWNEACPGKR